MLPEQTTATGETRQRPGTAIERFLSPISRSEEQTGPAAKVAGEMQRVGFIPSTNTDTVSLGGKQMRLKPEESALLVKAQQKATTALARVVIDPTYQALPDNQGDPRWRYGKTTKQDVLEKVYRRYTDAARQQINPAIFKRARAGQFG
jgi:hypothetical protein